MIESRVNGRVFEGKRAYITHVMLPTEPIYRSYPPATDAGFTDMRTVRESKQ